MPPVPNVILAGPGGDAALADERRLLVADERGDRRRARQRGRRPDDPARVDERSAASAPGSAARRARPGASPEPSAARIDVTAALLASITWCAPSVSVHAIHESTVPTHRSRDPVGIERVEDALDLRGRGVRREAEPRGAVGEAADDRAEVLPALRRADGHARGAVPHDRGAALVGDPDRGDRRRRARRARPGRRRARPRPSRRRRTRPSPARGSRAGTCGAARGGRWRRRGRSRRGSTTCRCRRRGGPCSVPRCSMGGRVASVGPDRGRHPARPGVGEAELAGVEDAVRVERLLRGDEHVERRPERVADEPRPVEADAVVVAQRAAVGEDRPGPRVPRGPVEGLALLARGWPANVK